MSEKKKRYRPAPPLGWTTPARIVRVIDGDTVEVTIQRTLRIRLLDCWAPETRTKNLAEKALGIQAKEHLQALIAKHGPNVRLHVPTESGGELAELLTMGRVLGRLHLPGVGDVSDHMVAEGLATEVKAE